MSKKQQGAPAKTEPWTLFLGNKFQDGIAALFFFSFSFCAEAACQRWETLFNSQFFWCFYFKIPGKHLRVRALNSGPYFPSFPPPFFHNPNPRGRGHLLKSHPLGSRCLECFVDTLLVPNWASAPLECAVYWEFSSISRSSLTFFPCSWSPNAVWVLRHVSRGDEVAVTNFHAETWISS